MTEESQRIRRNKIFVALEQMKEKNEKITAQKVAEKVKMGKQTVLPIYKEWQETEALTDAERIELSECLIFSLKKEIAKEKFRINEQVRSLSEAINNQEHEILLKNNEITDLTQQFQEKEQNLTQKINQYISSEKTNNEKIAELNKKIYDLEKKIEILSVNNDNLNKRLEITINDKNKELQEQEKRLDLSHKKLQDYWIGMVDNQKNEIKSMQKDINLKNKQIVALQCKEQALNKEFEESRINYAKIDKEKHNMQHKVSDYEKIQCVLNYPEKIHQKIYELLQTELKFAENIQSLNLMKKQMIELDKNSLNQEKLNKENLQLKAFIKGLIKNQEINFNDLVEGVQ